MRRVFIITFFIFLLAGQYGIAQVSINDDGSAPHSTAMLDVKSSDKGLLIPRMTTAEIEAIYLPADGLQVYNTDNGKLYIFVESDYEWKEVSYASGIIQPNATYTIGTGGSCSNTVVHGVYYVSVLLKPYNYVTIEVNVTSLGQYAILSDTLNGYSFSGTGVFTTTGIQTVDLAATGTPIAEQTDTFTASASNNGGSCSFQVSPVVSPVFLCGMQFQDPRDGQMYNTVEIGTQCWMAENLNIGTMINSTAGGTNADGEQTNNGTIEKYCYANNSSNCDTYGGLYQWNEMMQYVSTEETQGVCMPGWHVPSDNELKILEIHLGMSVSEANNTGNRGTNEGSKLAGNGSLWLDGNLDSNAEFDASGFTVLPGGLRFGWSGAFSYLTSSANIWSSTEYGNEGFCRRFFYNYSQANRVDYEKSKGLSVRCIKD